MSESKRRRQAKTLRGFRKVHRVTGAFLFVVFFVVAVTGLLLGWKKHSGGALLADTMKGRSADPEDWRPMHELVESAKTAARGRISAEMDLSIDRLDVRPEKGIVKVVFIDGYWGVQVDCTTGEVLQIERRRSDFIEQLHDASFLDNYVETEYGQIKLIYTTITGTALLLFTITGFWLWYGPKRMRATPHS